MIVWSATQWRAVPIVDHNAGRGGVQILRYPEKQMTFLFWNLNETQVYLDVFFSSQIKIRDPVTLDSITKVFFCRQIWMRTPLKNQRENPQENGLPAATIFEIKWFDIFFYLFNFSFFDRQGKILKLKN